MGRSSALWLIALGVCLTGVGVFFYYEAEQLSFHDDTAVFEFLSGTFLPSLFIGLLVSLIGSALWAWHAPMSKVAICGAVLSPLAVLARVLTPVNVHDWTESLDVSYGVALLIGILFLLLATGRFIFSKLARTRE